jgi:branched-chain amino acid transport system substrate-binding protein
MEGVLDHYAQVVNQAAELGIKARWFTGAGAANAIDPRGWDLTEGKIREHYTVSAYFSLNDPRRPEVNRFVSLYRAEFKTDPTLLSFYGWDAVQLYVDAVKRACTDTDREKFREALARTKDFAGLSGAITFANPPTGEVQNPTILVTATTGKGTWEEVR